MMTPRPARGRAQKEIASPFAGPRRGWPPFSRWWTLAAGAFVIVLAFICPVVAIFVLLTIGGLSAIGLAIIFLVPFVLPVIVEHPLLFLQIIFLGMGVGRYTAEQRERGAARFRKTWPAISHLALALGCCGLALFAFECSPWLPPRLAAKFRRKPQGAGVRTAGGRRGACLGGTGRRSARIRRRSAGIARAGRPRRLAATPFNAGCRAAEFGRCKFRSLGKPRCRRGRNTRRLKSRCTVCRRSPAISKPQLKPIVERWKSINGDCSAIGLVGGLRSYRPTIPRGPSAGVTPAGRLAASRAAACDTAGPGRVHEN